MDEYLPIVDRVDDIVDELEERIFDKFDDSAIHEIFRGQAAGGADPPPPRPAARGAEHPDQPAAGVHRRRPSQVYFRDVYDHTIRIVESVESTRDLLTSVLDTYLSQASNRLNKSMKSLSVVATISLPLVVIGGMFGMNFAHIPLSDHPLGFFWAVGMMVAAGRRDALVPPQTGMGLTMALRLSYEILEIETGVPVRHRARHRASSTGGSGCA